ncbi:MAG TPA: aspartate aminotransferase family protein [Jiangellaceae bacterium]|nr:aspartate aminotransferase family protein [Jiangellaceae bacterium]
MSHEELLARHRAVMPSWLALYYDEPIALSHGQGRRVWDAEGKAYLDFFGGILTTMTAHALPEVVEAIREQSGRMLHTSTLYMIEPAVELAEQIAELAPIPEAKVFFTTSGTEANEAALLLACTARRSQQVLAMRNSYHGRSFAAMGITGNRGWSASSLSPVDVSYVQGGYRYRSPFADLDDAAYIQTYVDDLQEVIATTTAGDVACLIAEPIQGVGGFAMPPDGFFAPVKEVCDQHGIVFITDEVQTGWGRTGEHFWGIDAHGVTPDILTFAKGLGNGVSLAGVVARADLMDALPGNSISTFGGNPLSCAAGVANLRYLRENDLQQNAHIVGEHLTGRVRSALEHHEAVGDIRGKGLMLGVELVRPGGTTPAPEAASHVLERCRAGGLLIGKGGLYGNVLRIAPPMTLTMAEADEGAEIIIDAITSL